MIVERFFYVDHRQKFVSRRCERINFCIGFLFVFQRLVPKIHSAGRGFHGGGFCLRQHRLEHFSHYRIYWCEPFVGGALIGCNCRVYCCVDIQKSRPAKTGNFLEWGGEWRGDRATGWRERERRGDWVIRWNSPAAPCGLNPHGTLKAFAFEPWICSVLSIFYYFCTSKITKKWIKLEPPLLVMVTSENT